MKTIVITIALCFLINTSWAQDLKQFEGLNGKYGYNDAKGNNVIPPTYQKTFDFKNGLGIVVLEDKWGYIDNTGKVVVPLKYDELHWFSEDLAVANYGATKGELSYAIGGKYGYIDKAGKEVIPFIYDKAGSFKEGLAPVNIGATRGKYSMSGGKYGFIDKTGQKVIPFIYERAGQFSGGLALVVLNDKVGFIDKLGDEKIPFKYDNGGSFNEGLACVKQNGKYGYINQSDEAVIPFIYENANFDFKNGLSCVSQNGLYGYIDRTGKIVIPLKFEQANAFYENLANVKMGGKWGYIDTLGKIVIDAKYDYAGMFIEGKARVKLDDKEFYINESGLRIKDVQSASVEKKKPKEEAKPVNAMEDILARARVREEMLKKMDPNYKGSGLEAAEKSYENLIKTGNELKNKISKDTDALIQFVKIVGNKNLNEIKETTKLLGVTNFISKESTDVNPITKKEEKCIQHNSKEKILDGTLGLTISEFTSGNLSLLLFLKNPYFKNLNDKLQASGLKLIDKNGSWAYWGNTKGIIRMVDIEGSNGHYGGDCIIYNR